MAFRMTRKAMLFGNRIRKQEFLTSHRVVQAEVFTETSPDPFLNPRFRTAFSIREHLARYLQNIATAEGFSRKCFTLCEFGAALL